MTESQAREEICRVGASLFARGYVHATAGNISTRLAPEHGGGFLITPTDACLGFLDPAQLARIGDDGAQLSGARASKTITLHRAIYRATEAAGQPATCVMHTHSTHLVALTLRRSGYLEQSGELLPPITPYFVMKVGRVPLVPYQRPGAPAVAQEVAQLIAEYASKGRQLRAVMLDRLGPNVWHRTPSEAMATLEELEETAKLWLLSDFSCSSLGDSDLAELRETFAASW
ncbi:class II aldolase/adducin family protein [Acidovorax sp. LjRoot117]|uniref:class II aldolase/adducin family protein n=1 Tax=Acidovorax sp. LjRoot117 TaxID=3342255 RepID=UPI003ECE72C5